jgi:hypothetical protein
MRTITIIAHVEEVSTRTVEALVHDAVPLVEQVELVVADPVDEPAASGGVAAVGGRARAARLDALCEVVAASVVGVALVGSSCQSRHCCSKPALQSVHQREPISLRHSLCAAHNDALARMGEFA